MRGRILAAVWIITMVGIGTCVNLTTGCAGDGKRETWQDCAGVGHEICRMMPDSGLELDCEYEYYQRCINE